jgi:capsular exopolysaccharide synthesis family protein
MTPDRFDTFFRGNRVDAGDTKSDAAAARTQKVAAGIPLGKIFPRELVITPEVVMVDAPRSPGAERFRRLKTLLVHDETEEPNVIVVTSALPSEGKSLVSLNLALAFAADLNDGVLLIDADMRRPGVNRWLKPAPMVGLKEVLAGEAELEHGLLEIRAQHLAILPAGQPAKDPVKLLSSGYARTLIETLRGRFKKIIIDTPPVVPFTDADIAAAFSDGVVLVARSKVTPKPLLDQAIHSITSARILGLVLNDTAHGLADHYRNYDGYYSKYYHPEAKP